MDLLLEARKIRYYCLVLPHTLLSSLSHCYMYFLHNNNIGLKIVDTCSTGLPKLSSRDSRIQVVWNLLNVYTFLCSFFISGGYAALK